MLEVSRTFVSASLRRTGRGKRSSTGLGRPAISVISRARTFDYRTSVETLRDPFAGRSGRYPAFRLLGSLQPARFYASTPYRCPSSLLPPSPDTSSQCLKSMSLHENAEIVSILGLPAHVKGSSKIRRGFHVRAHHKFSSRYPAVKLLHYLRLTFIRVSGTCFKSRSGQIKMFVKSSLLDQRIHYI